MESLLSKASGDTNLIVFPELATTGILKNKAMAAELAEDLATGPTVKKLPELSKKTETYIVTGIAENANGDLYNSAVLVGPEGLIGKYRKLHLTSADKAWALPGDLGLPYFDIPAGRVGLLVGYDLVISEPDRCLSIDGCDVICVPAALEGPAPITLGPTEVPFADPIIKGDDPHQWHLAKGRAYDNSTFLIFSNQHGDGMMGLSGVFANFPWGFPRNEAWASKDEDEVVSINMDTTSENEAYPTSNLRAKDFVSMRQPYWYGMMVEKKPPILDIIE